MPPTDFPARPAPGVLVEFMQGDNPLMACVTEASDRSLRVWTINKREMKLPAARVLPWLGPALDPGMDRAAMEEALAAGNSRRGELAASIDPVEIWESLDNEVSRADARFLAELLWQEPDADQVAAMGRALLSCKTRFKFSPPAFQVLSPEQVEEKARQAEAARVREEMATTGHEFLLALYKRDPEIRGPEGLPPLDPEVEKRLARTLRQAWSDDLDKEGAMLWRQLAKGLGEHPQLPLILARRWGIVEPHHNHHLDRAGYHCDQALATEHADEVQGLVQAGRAARSPEPGEFVSIDSATTRDIDDAFIVQEHEQGFTLDIALACPALAWEFDAPLDLAVRDRATSIYLPEATCHMLPEVLATDAYSLVAGQPRPALVMTFSLDSRGRVLDTAMRRTTVQVTDNLAYSEAETMTRPQGPLEPALRLARLLRQARIEDGAIVIDRHDPEIRLVPEPDSAHVPGLPRVELVDPEPAPGAQLMVSEFMILANARAAALAQEAGAAMLYRTQNVNLGAEAAGVHDQPLETIRLIKHFGPTLTATRPGPHQGLGVSAYAPVSSPLRRYPDLVNQAQLLALAQGEPPPFGRDRLEAMLPRLANRLEAAGQVQRFRPRYWKLVYLLQNREASHPAILADHGGGMVTFSLTGLSIFVRAPENLAGPNPLPGTRYNLRFSRIDPLANEIQVGQAERA